MEPKPFAERTLEELNGGRRLPDEPETDLQREVRERREEKCAVAKFLLTQESDIPLDWTWFTVDNQPNPLSVLLRVVEGAKSLDEALDLWAKNENDIPSYLRDAVRDTWNEIEAADDLTEKEVGEIVNRRLAIQAVDAISLKDRLDAARKLQDIAATLSESEWPEPEVPDNALLPVPALARDMMPKVIADRVFDVAGNIGCPPEFVAVPLVIDLGLVVGRKCLISPWDGFLVCPNLWGYIVGRPGAKKSPAIQAAHDALDDLARRADVAYESAINDPQRQQMLAARKASLQSLQRQSR